MDGRWAAGQKNNEKKRLIDRLGHRVRAERRVGPRSVVARPFRGPAAGAPALRSPASGSAEDDALRTGNMRSDGRAGGLRESKARVRKFKNMVGVSPGSV